MKIFSLFSGFLAMPFSSYIQPVARILTLKASQHLTRMLTLSESASRTGPTRMLTLPVPSGIEGSDRRESKGLPLAPSVARILRPGRICGAEGIFRNLRRVGSDFWTAVGDPASPAFRFAGKSIGLPKCRRCIRHPGPAGPEDLLLPFTPPSFLCWRYTPRI